MKRTFTHILYIAAVALLAGFTSCSDDVVLPADTHPVINGDGGTLLSLSVKMGNENTVQSRLAELGGDNLADKINTATGNNDLKHIGLYMYYEDDYKKDDLSHPYIRNMRCNITDGKLTPCNESGNPLTAEQDKIYIYDRMQIVIFYPYNKDMSDEKNFFKKKIDEEAYPISRSDYSKQDYIPYRGEVKVNPTNAYYREIWLQPKHTAKIEIVLVSSNKGKLPTTADYKSGNIKILPKLDPYSSQQEGGNGYSADMREHWLDAINKFPKENATPTGGLYTYQYVAYLWTSKKGDKHHDNENNNHGNEGINVDHNHWDNNIVPGDIVFQSQEITLFSSQQVNLAEQRVYRYGYNMDTGEIFIPTSSTLIYDANSFYETGYNEYAAYQVCDINIGEATTTTKEKSIFNATYDGGGHKITGLNIENNNASAGQQIGLFTNMNGTSYIRNVNLIEPQITITATDSCFVGSLCGHVNPKLTEEQINELGKNLPEGLSAVVKAELLKDLITEMTQTTSQIISCRVENPTITVTGPKARVGALCGVAGDKDEQGKYYAKIWDSYSLDGTITVNTNNKENNKTSLVGGLCGANNGRIINSYSTTQARAEVSLPTSIEGTEEDFNHAAGICKKGAYAEEYAKDYFGENKPRYAVIDCYTADNYVAAPIALLMDNTITIGEVDGVKKFDANGAWPDAGKWVTYTGKWPVYSNDWKDPDNEENTGAGHPTTRSYWQSVGSSPSTYPTLLWERD